ncbi:MAG: class I SAM-dependent methyltransferase, partial [Spirochaetia bacterium]|nr:class I SAM-dependent methyltransferase [Spirochaetia bacterium]
TLRRALSVGPKKKIRVLDVGCGAGQLAGGLGRKGFSSAGVDTSKAAIAAAKKRFPGVDFRVGRIGASVFPPASFDAVTLFHVLEHIPKPLPFLRAIHKVLKPEGVFLLRVPNIASFEARLAGKKWFHFDYPWHVVHYSPKALRKVLKRAGFSSISINHNPGEYKQSLLYAVFAFLGMKHIPVPLRVASLPLQIIFAPLSWILGLAGSGATIEALAKK